MIGAPSGRLSGRPAALDGSAASDRDVDVGQAVVRRRRVPRLIRRDEVRWRAALGVDQRFAYNIIKKVGNYGENFDQWLGSGSELKLERGLNELWTKGGLVYAPPFR